MIFVQGGLPDVMVQPTSCSLRSVQCSLCSVHTHAEATVPACCCLMRPRRPHRLHLCMGIFSVYEVQALLSSRARDVLAQGSAAVTRQASVREERDELAARLQQAGEEEACSGRSEPLLQVLHLHSFIAASF